MQKAKPYSNLKHLLELQSIIKDKKAIVYKKNTVTAFVPIRIENGKARYKLKLNLDQYGHCDVYIIEPKIKKYCGKSPPHIYRLKSVWNEKKQEYDLLKLCLYLPGKNEYDKYNDNIVYTIISWAIKWTEFYELWLLTGTWYGGGIHPASNSSKEKEEKTNDEKNN